MPLALDLISALVMGSTLPVATTLLANGPCSTLAFLSSGILEPPRVKPAMIKTMINTTTMIPAMMKSRFFLLLPLPFATNASAGLPKIVRPGEDTQDRKRKFLLNLRRQELSVSAGRCWHLPRFILPLAALAVS